MADNWPGTVVSKWPGTVVSQKAKPRGVVDEVGRSFGRAARAGLGALASVGDVAVMAANAPAYIGHALSGTPYSAPTPFGDMAARASNALGLPTDATDMERFSSAVTGGAVSALPFLVTGGASAAPSVARLATEGVAGGAAGAAGELARQAGLGPLGQLAAAFAGGIGGGAGTAAVANRVARGAAPASRSLAERVAAKRLEQTMSDPARAMQRLNDYGASVVPGVRPTLAEATGDQGVVGLARSMTNTARGGAAIRQAAGENTQARTSFIDDTFGPGSVDTLNQIAADAIEGRSARVGEAVGKVGESVPPEVAGMQARDRLQEASDAVKGQASALYKSLPGGDEVLQIAPIDPYAGAGALPRPVNPETATRESFRQQASATYSGPDAPQRGALVSWIISKGGIKPYEWSGELGAKLKRGGLQDLRSQEISNKSRVGLFNNRTGSGLDELAKQAVDEGFFPEHATGKQATITPDDLVQAITDEIAGRSYRYADDGTRQIDNAEAVAQRDYWGRALQDHGNADVRSMTDEDWDSFYRSMNEQEPMPVTQADMETLAAESDKRPVLSPTQSLLLDLRRRFMGVEPMGNGPIDALVRQFVNADNMATRDVEDIARRLREQAGLEYGTREGAYATTAADAVEAFLRKAAPPERVEALREAQKAWRDWASTFNQRGTPIATALRKDYGQFRQPDSTVGATLVPAGRTGGEYAGRLSKAVGEGDAETLARTELRRAIDAAGDRGADLRKVKAKYADTLRAYPALKADVDAAVETAALADAFRMSPMGKLADPSANASKLIGTIIQNGDVRGFKQIAAYAKTPEAKAGLRRAMANYVAKAGERGGGVAGADNAGGMTELQHVGNTVKALDKVLAMQAGSNALDKVQVASLKAVKEELERANAAIRLNPALGSNTSRDARNLADLAGSTIMETIGKLAPGASVASAVMRVMSAARMTKAEDILVQALIDPVFAKQLLMRADVGRVRGALSMIAARQAAIAGAPVSTVAANDVGAMTAAAAAQPDESQK